MPVTLLYVAEAAAVCILLFLLSRSSIPMRSAASREVFIDVLKGLSIVFVVAIHATSLYPSLNWINSWLWAGLGFFALASGYVLYLNYADNFDAKRYFSRMFTRLIVPYVLISIFFLAITATPILDFPAGLLFGRANGNYYFIPLLVCLYVLFPVLRACRRFLFSPFTLTLIYIFSLYFWNLHYTLSMVQWNANEWSLIFFGRYLFFFVFGMYLSQFELTKIPARIIATVLTCYVVFAIALSIYVQWRYTLLFYPVATFFVVLLLYRASQKLWLWKWFAILGPQTLFIYLLHTTLVYNAGGPQFAQYVPLPDWIGFIIIVSLITYFTYLVSLGLQQVISHFQKKPIQPMHAKKK